jgi:ribokinase
LFLVEKGLRHVILTLGANGSLHATRDGSLHIPAFEVAAVDSTGAGDAFIGSLACFLAEGIKEDQAIRRANLYAALSTLGIGTQKSFASRDQFDSEWSKRN